MLLLALAEWLPASDIGRVIVHGDAQGVLQGALKRKVKSPGLSPLMGELALLMALKGHVLEAVHVLDVENAWADALSRGECPPELSALPRGACAWRGGRAWRVLQA